MKLRSPLLAAVLLALGCQAPARTPLPPEQGDPCERLAYVFFLVAENKQRGRTREEEIEIVRASVDNPFSMRREATLRSLLAVVDLVYLQPAASAEEVRQYVLDRCTVNEKGHAVLPRPAH